MTVPFQRASITSAEKNAVLRVLDSGWLTTGSVTHEFETLFAQFLSDPTVNIKDESGNHSSLYKDFPNALNNSTTQGNIKALAVNSNTSGMLLALESLGVARGNYIITTCYTFNSTPMAARHLGSDVIFCDVAAGSYNIDCDKLESLLRQCALEKKIVKAVVPVHIGGVPCDMKRILALSKEYGFSIVEDCAHAFPTPTPLGYAGTIGDIGVFSFYATKTITTAEGGMVVTKNDAIARRISTMRLHGMSRDAWDRYTNPNASWQYDIIAPGYKCNLPDVLAAIGVEQLKRANELRDKRRAIFNRYKAAFSNNKYLINPPDCEGNSCHLFLLRVNKGVLGINRDTFARKLQDKGIGISVHFIPCCNFTYWKELYGVKPTDYPNAMAMYEATISLPLFPDMSSDEVTYVIDSVLEIAG